MISTATRRFFALTGVLASLAGARGDVIISEYLASNHTGLQDADGDRPDWIELYNTGASPVSLAGWHLTDQLDEPKRWELPAVTIAPGQYLVIFASGKDHTEPGKELHTSFSLSVEGESVALTNPAGAVVDVYAASTTPPQSADVSYGRLDALPAAVRSYFTVPTPGAPNDTTSAPVNPPGISPDGGTFTGTLQVILTPPEPETEIRYTLNGTLPGPQSPLYTGPVSLTTSTRIRAASFKPDRIPSPVASRAWLQLDPALTTTSSNLPLLIFHNFGLGRPDNGSAAQWMILEPGDNGRASLSALPTVTTPAWIKVRGSSTAGAAKYSLAVEARTASGEDREIAVTGFPGSAADWVLQAPYEYDRSLIRNPLIYQLSRDAGRYAVRTRPVEVYLNTTGGTITPADYAGVFTLMEKIERGRTRVDLAELDADDNSAPEIGGGYMVKIDRGDPGDAGFTGGGQQMYWVEPKESDVTPAQYLWFTGYLNAFAASLSSPDFFDPANGYAKWCDPAAFIDHHLLNVAAKNVDALRLSAYFSKDRYGRFTAGPVWDFDRSMDSTDGRDDNFNTWRGETGDLGTDFFRYPWYSDFFRDRNFWQQWIDRLEEMRQGPLGDEHISAVVASMATELQEAAPRNFARWPDKPPRSGGWTGEVDHLRTWLLQRLAWMDSQFTRPASASPPPGPVEAGTTVTLTSPSLTRPGALIYYTLDGTDPRAFDDTQGQTLVSAVFVPPGAPLRGILPTADPGTAWREDPAWDDSAWWPGSGGAGYDDTSDYDPWIGLNLESPPAARRMKGVTRTCLLRFPFSASAAQISETEFLRLRIRYDDGFVAWINGARVAAANDPPALAWNSGALANHVDSESTVPGEFVIPVTPGMLREGANVLAIHGLNFGVNSSDFLIQPELTGARVPADGPETAPGALLYTGPVTLTETTQLTARVFDPAGPFDPWPYTGAGSGQTPVGSHWSAPLRASYRIHSVPATAATLTVSEIMYHPADATPAEAAAGFPDEDDFEFLELTNVSQSDTLDLTGVMLGGSVSLTIPPGAAATVPPGHSVLLVADPAAFARRYGPGFAIAGTYSGRLGNSGGRIILTDSTGGPVTDFNWDDLPPWPVAADGAGASLERVHPDVPEDLSAPSSWRASLDLHGTPGSLDGLPFAAWQARHFPGGGTASGPAADPDGDSIPNALEFFLTGDPAMADNSLLPALDTTGPVPALTFRRRSLPAGSWTMEESADLLTWSALPPEGVTVQPQPDGTESVHWLLPAAPAAGPAFYRLRIVAP